MKKSKLIDCMTFFDNNFIFELRYEILKDYVDHFVICESKYDHKGNKKNSNFDLKTKYDSNKITHILKEDPFPKENTGWQNQAIQREYLLKNLNFAEDEDYIFFSDPDEIPNPKILKNFELKKKYGIFLQKFFNYKFNLFNSHESPWEGTRVAKKKNLKSINFMREKVKSKNLKYGIWRLDKEKNIEIFENGGWHFNNILSAKNISLKLRTFAHTEYSKKEFTDEKIILKKIENKEDLFNRGYRYKKIELDSTFPKFLIENKKYYKNFILN